MILYTKEIKRLTPRLGTNANGSLDGLLLVFKLFTPWSNWTWYVAEADFDTGEAFGLACGFENEVGYFDLRELEALRGPLGLKVERDRHFKPCTYAEIMRKIA